MDADDIMVSDRLQSQYEYMEAHPGIDILGGHMHCFNAGEYDCILPVDTDITMPLMLEQCKVANPTSFIRRSSFVAHHLAYRHESIYAEDYNLWLDALMAGLRIRNLDKIVVHYRLNSQQISCKYKEIQTAHTMALKDKYDHLSEQEFVTYEKVEKVLVVIDKSVLSLSLVRLMDWFLEIGLGGLLLYFTARIGHVLNLIHLKYIYYETK